MGAVTYPTLEHVAQEARPYPTHLLTDCETGLCLFAAAFLGHNDAIHFAEAGIKTTCVDVDGDRLEIMADLYPEEWHFVCRDAWTFARHHRDKGHTWDVVSVDTFTGDAMDRSMESLDLWLSLATRAVVVGTTTYPIVLPAYLNVKASYYERAAGIYWLCLERL